MPPKDKRARQKAHRDALRRTRERDLRRRRLVRTVAALLAVLLIALLVAATIAGDDRGEAGRGGSPTDGAGADETPDLEAACNGKVPQEADPQQYDAPQQVLEPGMRYRAVIHTSCGDITADLDRQAAPKTVNSFVFLAQEGFYDGLTFHRVVANFVIQGGDPNGDGSGGPGYQLPDELPEKSNEYVFGALAMANSGPDTSGSQFFVVTHDAPKLDSEGKVVTGEDAPEPAGLQALYSLFGEVTEDSYAVLKRIQKVPVVGETPVAPVYITSIEIQER